MQTPLLQEDVSLIDQNDCFPSSRKFKYARQLRIDSSGICPKVSGTNDIKRALDIYDMVSNWDNQEVLLDTNVHWWLPLKGFSQLREVRKVQQSNHGLCLE